MGSLYFGDNLDILREHIKDESINLVYLDPPFNSKRDYNLLFRTPKGQESDAQITAFDDTWHWGEQAEKEFSELLHQSNTDVSEMIQSLRRFLKESDMMAYLAMMANRLVELHRVLKPSGSLYLHCDPTASHYLKIVLDTVFEVRNFRNEIIWRRYGTHNDVGQGSKHFGRVHDVILFCTKTDSPTWNQVFTPLDPAYVEQTYTAIEPETGRRFMTTPLTGPGGAEKGNPVFEWKGHTRAWRYSKETMERLDREGKLYYSKTGYVRQKAYLDESKGVPVQDEWTDIPSLSGAHAERLGYPTQKPLALLERIIQSSSNEGDVILDPFCGCGTAVHAAETLKRDWIGIDITHLAISLIEKRMKDAFPSIIFEVHGTPKDLGGARNLAERDKYQFQWWACSLVNAQPYQGKKKGADSGIDGIIFFQDDEKGAKKIIVSVKGGESVTRTMIADLKNSVEREKAEIGLFVTLAEATKPMITEAASAGFYESPFMGAFPKIQILTIDDLLSGREKPKYPDFSRGGLSFKKAKIEQQRAAQNKLEGF
jgi:DNA modification methylase